MTGSRALMGVWRKRFEAKTSASASSASFSLGGESERSSADEGGEMSQLGRR